MIEWGSVLAHALWIGGLALGLAAVSIAYHQAAAERRSLGQKLLAPPFLAAAQVAAVLVCLGILLGASAWWIRGMAAALATALSVWAVGPRLQRWRAGLAGRSRPQEPSGTAAPLGRGGILGWSLVVAGLLVIGVWGLVTIIHTLDRARSLQAHLAQFQTLAEAGAGSLEAADLARVAEHVEGLHQDLAAIEMRIGPLLPLGRFLAWMPTYGGDLAAAADLLEWALRAAAAADRSLQALSPALALFDGANGEPTATAQLGEALLPILVAARPELEGARQDLLAAEQSRMRVDAARLSPRAAGLVERLDRYLPWLRTAVEGALLAPSLLGADGPRTYLAVAQNNHELRATGGFVSGVGEIRVEEGRILPVDFRDSYAVDNFAVPHEAAPADLQAALSGEMWLFRDANWHPDLPTSAREMLDIYARDQGVSADGLVALDLTALELLLEALGPLTVEGIDQPVTAGNVQEVLQAQWAAPASGPEIGEDWSQAWWEHRKDSMGEIAAALLGRIQGGEEIRLGALLRALNQALEEKHILLYLADAEASNLLRRRNWDGALPAANESSDFLMVVDSNVGFNKVDPNITRRIRYEVDLTRREGPQSHLTLTYLNQSTRPVEVCVQKARYRETYADMMDRCYWDYVRVYVPAGSRLLSGPDLALPAGSLLARTAAGAAFPAAPSHDGELAVWSAFFDLAPGEERTLTFHYELPPDVLEGPAEGPVSYHLRVQKQPGTGAVPLEVALLLPPRAELVEKLPAGLALQSTPESAETADVWVLSTDLGVDRQIKVAFRWGDN